MEQDLKQKQIEEMAFIQCESCKKYTVEALFCDSKECLYLRKKYAEELYNAGYRKIPENAVVLTEEQYKDLIYWEGRFDEIVKSVYETTRKETAKEIWEDITSHYFALRVLGNATIELDKLAEFWHKHGVDVE